ncbi:MAG: Asp-tRNA(Asn)/Glu-tRNA(Gln) amidotransferase subunit GatB [Candidatus Colwellbacteria bacterium]|nr:Asp-tRNA(Asn)/Glu-tRNA(Gln) amidotransferase subunit GatB [Candidatus Colwellbacteria bacterium]
MAGYKVTIGLEIHAELNTKTKMFCGCLNPAASSGLTLSNAEWVNDLDEKHPNVNVCPVCLGHPGVLPVANREAINSIVRIGLAVGGEIPEFSKFDRKSYFYPDLPKGYQISQYDEPLVKGGKIAGVKLTRVHLEEDTARSIHDREGGSLVDFNRSGVPLMELVTEPVITSADEALRMAKELQLILRYLNVSEANMEKGEMRVEANVSVSKGETLGTKVEVKNINSFRAVKDAIAYEVNRQTEVLEEGGKVIQETRGWDDVKQETFSQRSKEEAHDYRYIPEPDIPPIRISKEKLEELRLSIPEMPGEKRKRLAKEYGLAAERVEILVADKNLAGYFEEAVSEAREISEPAPIDLLFNYLTTDLKGLLGGEDFGGEGLKITPENFAELVVMLSKNQVSSRVAKDVLKKMFETGVDPNSIVGEAGLHQISGEEEVREFVKEAIAKNPKAVEDYKKGKENASQFIVGQVMGKTKGRANPEVIKKILSDLLK